MDIELGQYQAFAGLTTIAVDLGDAIEHQHVVNGQLSIAGAE